jgi:hypothetical protein
MRRWIYLGALGSLLGCEPPRAANAPIPSDVAPAIERVRVVGREIYELDHAAANAADTLTAARPSGDDRVRGFVTMLSAEGFRTSFVDATGAQLHEVIEAKGGHPTLTPYDPPQPLDAGRAAMVRAIATARKAPCQPTARARNPVVLPAERLGLGSGWLVWLLIGVVDPREVPLAGHCRVHVSADGGTIVKTTPLSKTVVVDVKAPDLEAFGITSLDPLPNEAQVATSLTYDVPILVATERALWTIRGDRVSYTER